MTAETDAFTAAEAAIADALKTGAEELNFNHPLHHALTTLPPQIADLSNLTHLILNDTQVTDLTSLQGLSVLRTLILDGTQVADLTALQGLTALQVLDLTDTLATDLSPLQGLAGLQRLDLDSTQVTNLAPLQGLAALKTLVLDNTQVTDLAPLQGLTGLQTLHLENTQVTDLTPLQNLAKLQTLRLGGTQIADPTPLQGLAGLQTLTLSETQITDLTPLQGLAKLQMLYLSDTQVTDLTPLQGLAKLQTLLLDTTQITDLRPLQGLAKLRRLHLSDTQVTDLTPLQGLAKLQTLRLDTTQVTDLRPIADLPDLGKGLFGGLWFAGTPAARATSELTRLSEMKDAQTRTSETLAYLKTLPPWPQPLPWDIPDHPPDTPPIDLDPAPVPRLILTSDFRVDVDTTRPTADDLSDPIKERLYTLLPDAAQTLARFGNRFVEVKDPAEALRDLTAVDFVDADMLDIHLQVAALMDVKEADPGKKPAERLDADCMAALNAVLRLGPPVTMGHPDVDLFEDRNTEFAKTRHPATAAEGERQITGDLAKNETLATDRARKSSDMLSRAGDTGRVAAHRKGFTQNAIMALGVVAGAMEAAVLGYVPGTIVAAAIDFLLVHKDAIMATAPSWGENGYRWAADLITWANQKRKEFGNPPD